MLRQFYNRNFYIILLIDMVMFILSLWMAYCLRFELSLSTTNVQQIRYLLVWIIPVKLFLFWAFNLYKGMWRYTGISDLIQIVKACTVASSAIALILIFTVRLQGYPRSIFIIDWILTLMFCSSSRLFIRIWNDGYFNFNGVKDWSLPTIIRQQRGKPILIIGAGDAGEKTLREIRENPELNYWAVGYLDDDSTKHGRTIHSVPVLGNIDSLKEQIKKYHIESAIIAMPSAKGEVMRRVVDICKSAEIEFRTLPGIYELIGGTVSIKNLRDVRYEDLLGRQPVRLDNVEIAELLTHKRVLVSGAGGSIGSELCRQIVKFNPLVLILQDVSEHNLYAIEMELKHKLRYIQYVTILGSIQREKFMDDLIKRYKPDIVFHAAAYKHVPMVEENPWQAVQNNIHGTRVLIERCIEYRVKDFVLVSTDKSVRPTNVMGASKRVCEMMMQAYKNSTTRMTAVRFGNVVGSSGSVIPLFRNQIEQGGPVTVTHPEITRFFMTIPEACQLILQAATLGKGGEIFILEMGTPVKIADMARDLIRLSGKEPDTEIKIEFTGLRPGEKLYEELITEGEDIVETQHEKIMVLNSNGFNGNQAFLNNKDEYLRFSRGDNYHSNPEGETPNPDDNGFYRDWLLKQVDELITISNTHDGYAIRAKLKEIVPEYTPQDSKCVL